MYIMESSKTIKSKVMGLWKRQISKYMWAAGRIIKEMDGEESMIMMGNLFKMANFSMGV